MVQHNITVYIKLSAGYFYHAVIRQINSKLQIFPSNPLALELLMIGMFNPDPLHPPPLPGQSCVQMPYPRARFDGQMPLLKQQTLKSEN